MPDRQLSEILERLNDLERGARARDETLSLMRNESLHTRELLGSDIRAHELFKRLIVGVDDIQNYDHDTLVLLDDTERGYLRHLFGVQRTKDVMQAQERRKKQWTQTMGGRVAIVAAVLTMAVNAYRTLSGK